MNDELKVQAPWSKLAVFLSLMGGGLILYSLLGASVLKALGYASLSVKSSSINWDDRFLVQVLKVLQALSSVIVFLLPAATYVRIVYKGHYARHLGFVKAGKNTMYVLAVIAMISALPFVFWLGELNRLVPLPEYATSIEESASKQLEAFLNYTGLPGVLVNLFIIALLPAIGEELCFRSVLQKIMMQLTRNVWGGILLTGFLFSVLHFQFEGFIPRFFLGVVLGMLYWYSGSIWTSFLAHFSINAIQVIVASYQPEFISSDPAIPPLLAVSSGCAAGVVLYYYRSISVMRTNEVQWDEQMGNKGSS